jgi:hypothetical protein
MRADQLTNVLLLTVNLGLSDGRRLNAFEAANPVKHEGGGGQMEVLQSQSTRPRLQQRRSSRSSHSRSPSPWNLFSSACHRQEGPIFEGLGRPFNTRDDDDDRVYDNDGHARRDGYGGGEASEMTRDDSAWEVLSDRRASFEDDQTRNPAGKRADGQEDEDEATMLGRSIPGSYVKPVPGSTIPVNGRTGGGRYETLKSWKSADNGATGTRGWMEKSTSRYEGDGERMNMQDFGSNHGVHSRNGKRVLLSLRAIVTASRESYLALYRDRNRTWTQEDDVFDQEIVRIAQGDDGLVLLADQSKETTVQPCRDTRD